MITSYPIINLFYLIALIIFYYSSKKNNFSFALIEFFVIIAFGFIFETYNINIGQHYSYPTSYIFFDKVPLSILIAWYTIFMFGKFWTQLLLSINREFENNDYSIIPLIIISSAIIATTIGYLIDPIATRLQWWEWYEPTPFLNVPIGEFFGIFIATSLIGSIYWILLIIFSQRTGFKLSIKFQFITRIDWIMVLAYEAMIFILLFWNILAAVDDNDPLIGSTVTFFATQVIIVIILLIIFDKNDFQNDILKLPKNIFIFQTMILIGSIISALLIILTMIAMFNNGFGVRSLHMILASLAILSSGITLTTFFKYYELKGSLN